MPTWTSKDLGISRGKRHLRLVGSRDPLSSSLPATRGECEGGARPCPLISCKFNLSADVTRAGGIKIHWFPEDDPERPTCALDAADSGGLGCADVAALMGVTRERVRQLEEAGLRKMRGPMKDER